MHGTFAICLTVATLCRKSDRHDPSPMVLAGDALGANHPPGDHDRVVTRGCGDHPWAHWAHVNLVKQPDLASCRVDRRAR